MMAVARLHGFTGKTNEALSVYRRSELLLASLAESGPSALAELAACRSRWASFWPPRVRPPRLWRPSDWRGLTRSGWPRLRWPRTSTPRPRRYDGPYRQPAGATGRPAEAEAEYRAALPIRSKLVEENPDSTDFRKHLADCRDALGVLLYQEGKLSEAEKEWQAPPRRSG